jgi:hypothetical protein
MYAYDVFIRILENKTQKTIFLGTAVVVIGSIHLGQGTSNESTQYSATVSFGGMFNIRGRGF